jgi:hypothetical protein
MDICLALDNSAIFLGVLSLERSSQNYPIKYYNVFLSQLLNGPLVNILLYHSVNWSRSWVIVGRVRHLDEQAGYVEADFEYSVASILFKCSE